MTPRLPSRVALQGRPNGKKARRRPFIDRRRQALVMTGQFGHAQRLSQGLSTVAVGNFPRQALPAACIGPDQGSASSWKRSS